MGLKFESPGLAERIPWGGVPAHIDASMPTTLSPADAMVTASQRAYLAAVYPTASLEDDARVTALWSTLRFFYAVRATDDRRSCLNATTQQRQPQEREQRSTSRRTVPIAIEACGRTRALVGSRGCLLCKHDEAAASPSHGDAASSTFAPAWFEVRHEAYGRRLPGDPRAGPSSDRDWSAFMDAGAAGMWFYPARGSGIYYRAGRTLAAATKNEAVAVLLEALSAQENAERSRRSWPPYGLADLGLCRERAACARAEVLASRVRAAAVEHAGSGGGCRAAGLLDCANGHVLGDSWDALVVWLGRALGYDTVLLRSTLCGCGWACGPCAARTCPPSLSDLHPELIDLRVPDAVRWRLDGLNRTLFMGGSPEWRSGRASGIGSMPPPSTMRKHRDVAAAWMDAYQRDGTLLTLRDPLHLPDESRARPCDFRASRGALGCAGHPSAALAALESDTEPTALLVDAGRGRGSAPSMEARPRAHPMLHRGSAGSAAFVFRTRGGRPS